MLENEYRDIEADDMSPGLYVKVSIRDTGEGIDKESLWSY